MGKPLFDGYYTIIENPSTKDIMDLRTAYSAGRMSTHRTQVGAACGVAETHNESYDPKYPDVRIHAEISALLKNAKHGVPTQGATMYAPWAACPDCAMGIIAAGIIRVVVHHQRMQVTPHHWREDVEHGLHMLQQYGVRVEAVDKDLGEQLRISGEEVVL